MFLFGFGPVFKAVMRILKARIKASEMAFEAKRKAAYDAHEVQVAVLEQQRDATIDAHLETEVNRIFDAVK